jgi:hypothetical protein
MCCDQCIVKHMLLLVLIVNVSLHQSEMSRSLRVILLLHPNVSCVHHVYICTMYISGTRGIMVEQRAPPVPRLPQNTELLVNCQAGTAGPIALSGAPLFEMTWQKVRGKHKLTSSNDVVTTFKNLYDMHTHTTDCRALAVVCSCCVRLFVCTSVILFTLCAYCYH